VIAVIATAGFTREWQYAHPENALGLYL